MTTSRTPALVSTAALCGLLALGLSSPASAADGTNLNGHSFKEATAITAGSTVKQELVVGDMLLWRIDLEPGQKLAVEARTTTPAGYGEGGALEAFGIQIYDPVRQALHCGGDRNTAIHSSVGKGRDGSTLVADCSVGDPADNRDKPVELAGTYYVQVAMGKVADSRGTVLPIELSVNTGEGIAPTPTPAFNPGTPKEAAAPTGSSRADAAPPAESEKPAAQAPTSNAFASTTIPSWAWLVGAATLAAALLLPLLGKRRRPSRPTVRDLHAHNPRRPLDDEFDEEPSAACDMYRPPFAHSPPTGRPWGPPPNRRR
ncbi:hypothetical protein G6045_08725 [Streptomyces sp. YC504]|uniref:LPXTG cell wall anchor domain-containing protein n=1 Tax=Streptomyces mesophilus TaxID=1775132 RepID=A0A6G4XDW9_9ACTN|nr:hypothetical protein [Streptomyces mesophilus]NGO75756.1 hypothetical protein [Streptomyces mesophilus]